MPTLEEILHAIGSGIGTAGKIGGTALGAALTPPAMILAARQGRSPFTALPGYQAPLTPYQQAMLGYKQQELDQIAKSNAAVMGQMGGQDMAGGAEPAQPDAVAVPSITGGAPRRLTPATAGAPEVGGGSKSPRQMGLASVSVGSKGQLQPTYKPSKVKVYDQGTINPATGKDFQPGDTDPEGNPVVVKPPKMTATTQSMVESAPKVLDFVKKIRKNLDTIETENKEGHPAANAIQGATGIPAESYIRSAKTHLGISDPSWRQYSANTDLLTTLLMRMHQGARGGVAMMQHFKGILDQNRQSPENMRAVLDVIEDYANEIKGHKDVVPPEPGTYDDTSDIQAPTEEKAPAPSAAPGTTPSIEAARNRFRSIVSPGTVSRAAGGPVAAGQPAVVGEFGPEVITPQQPMQVQPTPMAAMRLQAVGGPEQNQARKLMQMAQVNPDQARGSAYTGMPATPTTTMPPAQPGVGSYGQGVGVDQQDLMRSRSQAGSWTWDPSKGRSVFVPAGT